MHSVTKGNNLRRQGALAVLALLTFGVGAGCGRPRSVASSSPAATPKPTPTPRAVRAQSTDVHLSMTDLRGRPLAVLNARSTDFDPLKAGRTVAVQGADAVLYEEGKPATRVRAKNLVADQKTRIITLTGNARAESLSRKDAPTARADRMIWNADQKLLTGDGNVMLTLKPDYEMPGRSFRADTKLNNFSVQQDERPGRGSF